MRYKESRAERDRVIGAGQKGPGPSVCPGAFNAIRRERQGTVLGAPRSLSHRSGSSANVFSEPASFDLTGLLGGLIEHFCPRRGEVLDALLLLLLLHEGPWGNF